MSKQLPVDRGTLQQEDFIGQEVRKGIEKKSPEEKDNELIEAEMDNTLVDPDVVISDKDAKDLLCRQSSKPLSSSDEDEIDDEDEDDEEDEIEEADEEIVDEYEEDEVTVAKPITHVSRRDHEQRPKKRIALASEASRQQHSPHRGRNRKDHIPMASSSDDDEEYASDEVDDDSEPGQRRRHSQASALSSRRRSSKENEHIINWDDHTTQLKEGA